MTSRICWTRLGGIEPPKRVADNRREFDMLSESDAAEEEAMRRAFEHAYKVYWKKKHCAA